MADERPTRGATMLVATALAAALHAAPAAAEMALVSQRLAAGGVYMRGSDAEVTVTLPPQPARPVPGLVSQRLNLDALYARGTPPAVQVTLPPAPGRPASRFIGASGIAHGAAGPMAPVAVPTPDGRRAPIGGPLASQRLDLAPAPLARVGEVEVRVPPTPAPHPMALVDNPLGGEGAYRRGSDARVVLPALPPAREPVPYLSLTAAPHGAAGETAALELGTQPAPSGREAPVDRRGYRDGLYLLDKDYALSWPENAWRMATGPLRFERDDWINTALVVGGTAALFLLDEPINDFWQDNVRSGFTDDVADAVTPLGDTAPLLLGSLGAYTLAELLDARREKAAALLTFQGVSLSILATTGLKALFGRERPDEAGDAFDFGGPGAGDFNAALPSGHATTSFATATVLSEIYGPDNPWVPWLAYPTAGLITLSRLNDERHWASDIFLGGAIGYFVGRMVVAVNPFLENERLALSPSASPDTFGVNLTWRY